MLELPLTFCTASNNQFCREEISTETFKVAHAFGVLMRASLDRAWSRVILLVASIRYNALHHLNAALQLRLKTIRQVIAILDNLKDSVCCHAIERVMLIALLHQEYLKRKWCIYEVNPFALVAC